MINDYHRVVSLMSAPLVVGYSHQIFFFQGCIQQIFIQSVKPD